MSAGDGFSLILTKDHEVYSCGKGDLGRLGHGNTQEQFKPKIIKWFKERDIKVKSISAGGRHSLAIGCYKYYLRKGGDGDRLFGWGFGFYH